MTNHYKNNSYSGNKHAGYRHICRRKSRHRITCSLTLSYIPATQADADLIASYLPKPHADGTPILPSETSNTVGQATAIGISAGGISAVQLTQLKDRLTTTKTQLEAKNFTGLTGEQISGDLLTATIWSWFAATESHNRLSQNQANMIENQGLTTLKPQTFACPEVGLSNVVTILSAVVFSTPW